MHRVPGPLAPTQQSTGNVREFAMKFTSTPRGARLARHLVAHRLDEWGYPYESRENETLTLITAELAANAVRHGRVPGRDFSVRLTATVDPPATGEILRIEVADTRTEQRPPSEACLDTPPLDIESGRGLFLVSQLADRWGLAPRAEAPGKLVWAQLRAAGGALRDGRS